MSNCYVSALFGRAVHFTLYVTLDKIIIYSPPIKLSYIHYIAYKRIELEYSSNILFHVNACGGPRELVIASLFGPVLKV